MCTVPPIFSSRSVSSVGSRIASFSPNANSPSTRAPSSVSSAARRNACPVSAAGADPAPAADAHPEVGALGHDAQFVDCFELPHEPVLQVALGSPGHDGIGLIELERAPEQLAVGVQREPGRL